MGDIITLDIETSSLEPGTCQIHLIGYKIGGTNAVIQIERPENNHPDRTLNNYLSNPANTLRGHNIKFDALCLANHGYTIGSRMDDTRLLAYLRWPDEQSDLKHLVKIKLRKPVTALKDILIKPKKKKRGLYERNRRFVSLAGGFVSLERLKSYNREDILNCDLLRSLLPDTPWYVDCEQPLLRLLFEAELGGIYIDRDHLLALDIDFSQESAPIYEELVKYVKNPNSPIQVAEAYSKMGFDLSKLCSKTKTGRPCVDKMFLKKLAWKGHELSKSLLSYRRIEKLRTTYIQPLLERMDNQHRIHGSFNQAGSEAEAGDSQGTRTGRLTSSEPNLQNIPVRTVYGKAVRKAFKATPGNLLFVFDLKQIEPRLITHYSQSSKLVNAFKNKLDTHAMFGSDIFGKAPLSLTKMERFIGKTSWLATVYGCWYKELLNICEVNSDEPMDIDFSKFNIGFDGLPICTRDKLIHQAPNEEEARILFAKESFFNEVQENFRRKNPEIMSWRTSHIERTRRMGYLTTFGGRRIKIEGLDSKSKWDRAAAERRAVNWLIQGGAADIMKLILVRFYNDFVAISRGSLLAVVHDEILGETKTIEDVEFVREIMCDTVRLNNVDIDCDGGVIDNWGMKK